MQAQVAETKVLKEAIVGNEESTLFGQLKILRGDINGNAKNIDKYCPRTSCKTTREL